MYQSQAYSKKEKKLYFPSTAHSDPLFRVICSATQMKLRGNPVTFWSLLGNKKSSDHLSSQKESLTSAIKMSSPCKIKLHLSQSFSSAPAGLLWVVTWRGKRALCVPSLFPVFLCKSYIGGLTLECGIVGKYCLGALAKTESEIVQF